MPAQHLWSARLHRDEPARAPAWSGAYRRAWTPREHCPARWEETPATVALPAPFAMWPAPFADCAPKAPSAKDLTSPIPPRQSRTRARNPCWRHFFYRSDTSRSPPNCSRDQRIPERMVPREPSCYSSSNPASPSSAANASSVPLAFQASADTGSVPFLRTRISAPSWSRTIRIVPSL